MKRARRARTRLKRVRELALMESKARKRARKMRMATRSETMTP